MGLAIRKPRLSVKISTLPLSTHVVLIGWAGGLVAGLKAGDVVCANRAIMQGQPDLFIHAIPVKDDAFHVGNSASYVGYCKSFHFGAILTTSMALVTTAEKLAAQESGAIAVEMEAYPIAAWAQVHGILFSHVRVVLDAWDEPLPYFKPGIPGLIGLLGHFPTTIRNLAWLNRRIRSLDPKLGQITVMATDAILNSPQ